jgi:hypothetical protein
VRIPNNPGGAGEARAPAGRPHIGTNECRLHRADILDPGERERISRSHIASRQVPAEPSSSPGSPLVSFFITVRVIDHRDRWSPR